MLCYICTMRKQIHGVTLVELMIAAAVLGVLALIGIPSLTSFIQESRMISETNNLITDIQFTRSEAIKRNNRVTICQSSDGATCTLGGDWEAGWIVFDDVNENVLLPGAVLRTSTGTAGANFTIGAPGAIANFVSYTNVGASIGAAGATGSGTFSICDSRAGEGRAVQIGVSGRVKSSREPADFVCP